MIGKYLRFTFAFRLQITSDSKAFHHDLSPTPFAQVMGGLACRSGRLAGG